MTSFHKIMTWDLGNPEKRDYDKNQKADGSDSYAQRIPCTLTHIASIFYYRIGIYAGQRHNALHNQLFERFHAKQHSQGIQAGSGDVCR